MSLAARIADRAAELLERPSSRRTVLSRVALSGAAFAVAPLRYALRPGTAWGVIGPKDCSSGLCTDGYSAFCCEIEHAKNTCPPGTFVAGWWKCLSYTGNGVCHAEGVRYYLDCNRREGYAFPGGCQCANGNCNHRRVDCNHFRYGQCNAQVPGTTEVVCRLVICQDPSTIGALHCNDTLMIDNKVCSHEARCLEPLAAQLPGGSGA